MLALYKDPTLTRPAFGSTPKFFLFDEEGGTVTSNLWIGDTYFASLTQVAVAGDTTLVLDQTAEFPASGSCVINGVVITYTGTTATSLTGIPASGNGSISQAFPVGMAVQPVNPQVGVNLVIRPSGGSLSGPNPSIFISLQPPGGSFGLPNAAAILPSQTYGPGHSAVQVGISVRCVAGARQDFQDLFLEISNYPGNTVNTALEVFRGDKAPICHARALPPSRQIVPQLPGLVLGEYRWRDSTEVNAHAIVPSKWDVSVPGVNKFIAGIGSGDDLEFVSLEKNGISINPRIRRGFYFTGPEGYYLPSNPNVEFHPSGSYAPQSFVLSTKRKEQSPLFVGQFQLDRYGYYDVGTRYRYIGKSFSSTSQFDPADSGLQFTFDPKTQTVTLNQLQQPQPVFLGVMMGAGSASFDLPLYPVDLVTAVYADNPLQYTTSFSVDYNLGTITISPPDGSDWTGHPVYITCQPAVAVIYDEDNGQSDDTYLLDLDLNPAHAGIANGYIHLMHRRWKSSSLQLFADKPEITLPPSFFQPSTLQDLFGSQGFGQGVREFIAPSQSAYGPVYYENDYALLMVTAYGNSSADLVPDVRLLVTPGTNFQGTINYQDPTQTQVELFTGGDGTASMIYLPGKGYGYYLDPAASISGDRLTATLPAPIALSLVWNNQDGFYCYTYIVRNDDEFLGKVGANTALGETPWAVQGTPGTVAYKTNGRRILVKNPDGSPFRPSDLLDENGVSYLHAGFSGNVSKIVYPSALPTASYVGAYFIGVSGFSSLAITAPDYGIVSNVITLELAHPVEITDFTPDGNPYIPNTSGYLIFDSRTSGRLGINRLAGGPLPSIILNLPRI